MCGITARIGSGDAIDEIITGLENLEYRGYDSAGIAVRNGTGIQVVKQSGQISEIKQQIRASAPSAQLGIGHTRWSTHGPPSDDNAHPHTDCSGRLAVVHNGIIENHAELKTRLQERGHEFDSDTDTEVVPHLVEDYLERSDVETAFRRTVQDIEGSYAVAMIVDGTEAVFAARNGSPLIIGVDGVNRYIASDIPAFLEFTEEMVLLEDGDLAVVRPGEHRVIDQEGDTVSRPHETVDWEAEDASKGEFDHYMYKEICEQPTALSQTLQGRIDAEAGEISLADFPPGSFEGVDRLHFVACGTSYNAAHFATQWLANAGVQAYPFRAGEYAAAPAPADDETVVVGVTQSGETADTLAALRKAQAAGAKTIAVTNVVGSTAARLCDEALFIRAGPEIGVAATKTFTSQVASLLLLGERVVRDVTGSPSDGVRDLLSSLAALPDLIERVLEDDRSQAIAESRRTDEAFFFIGRGIAHPVAMEGALKFKEITYEHAEGFAAGELKHGPLALVTPDTPVFAVIPGNHAEKTLGNVEEIKARGAPVVAITPEDTTAVADRADDALPVPAAHPDVAAILANVQLQLVSYHSADLLDRSIDKPRNLAKSVTVR